MVAQNVVFRESSDFVSVELAAISDFQQMLCI